MDLLARLLIEGFRVGSLYGVIAIGFSLIWWVMGVVHIAHGGVLLAAAYAVYALVAAVVAMALGLVLERLLYRPLQRRGASELTVLTASFGALIVIEQTLSMLFGQDMRIVDADVLRTPAVTVAGLPVDWFTVLTLAGAAVVFALVGLFMARARAGRGLRALAANEELARVVGLDVDRLRAICIAIGSLLILPASLVVLCDTGVVPDLGLHFVLIATVVTIFGGIGSIVAALVGGLVIGLAESLMVWRFAAGWQDVVTFAMLYVVLLVRPQGLFGSPVSKA
jgi:branched-chain amino acid transport system permease protein